jgi:hypothetical protein
MQLLDNHLRELLDAGVITVAEAIRCASDPGRFVDRSVVEEPVAEVTA